MDEPIVINTSPLLALAACKQLELLRRLHRRVVVPEAVIAELERGQAGTQPMVLEAERPAWLEIIALTSSPSPLLTAYLDAGEAAVIALAMEQGIRRVVIDERRARTVARTMKLEVTGSIGILLRAKREGFIAEVKPSIEAMQVFERGGFKFRVKVEVCAAVLGSICSDFIVARRAAVAPGDEVNEVFDFSDSLRRQTLDFLDQCFGLHILTAFLLRSLQPNHFLPLEASPPNHARAPF